MDDKPPRSEPYVGPRPIQMGELLLGRDYEVRTLTDLLIPKRIVLLHSPSGAGKSSLINAGLIPALSDEGFRVLPVIRINKEPTAPATIKAPTPGNRFIASTLRSLETAHPEAQRLLSIEHDGLVQQRLLKYVEQRLDLGDDRPTVLIFDQFEEILTVDPVDLPAKQEFFKWLGEGLTDRRLWALFVIREDYIGAIEPYQPAIPTQLSVRMRLDLLGIDAACDAIRRPRPSDSRTVPADSIFETFTEQAGRQLAEDLRQVRLQQPDGTFRLQPGPYVEPILLQIVCKRLWDRWSKSASQIDVTMLTKDVATVDDALAGYYADEVSATAQDAEIGVTERAIRDWFDRQLIDVQGIRGQVLRGKDRSQGLDNRAIGRLIEESHLVRAEQRRGATWYELVHDRLIEPIRKNNVKWRESNLAEVQQLAVQWNSLGRPVSLLLRSEQLVKAEAWRKTIVSNLEPFEEDFLRESRIAQDRSEKAQAREAEMRTNLADTGWGVIFPTYSTSDPDKEKKDRQVEAIREALRELLEHRRSQASQRREEYYREFSGMAAGYRAGETAYDWLKRQGARIAQTDPQRVPHHLLIVGDPEGIPFEFQYELDVQYSVGRIAFDELEDYARYARSVVTAERNVAALPRKAVVFGPRHMGDIATTRAQPGLQRMVETLASDHPDWSPNGLLGDTATKAELGRLLGGPDTPSLLWVVAHGMGYQNGKEGQLLHQGAIVCADWPGPSPNKPLTSDMFFSGEDLSDQSRLLGLVVYLSSHYSAGTPRYNDFPEVYSVIGSGTYKRQEIAPHSFIADLPKRLLSRPLGGALAVIGHVERPWTTSYGEMSGDPQLGIMKRLMQGYTVGASLEIYNQLYAFYSGQLSGDLREIVLYGKKPDPDMSSLALETISSRNWIILGDPAVCLNVTGLASAGQDRPAIEPVGAIHKISQEPAPAETAATADFKPQAGTPSVPAGKLEASPSEILIFNGINGATGGYALPPMTLSDLVSAILGDTAPRISTEPGSSMTGGEPSEHL
jgi:hypothetical protein